jgi:hypothetical protein
MPHLDPKSVVLGAVIGALVVPRVLAMIAAKRA